MSIWNKYLPTIINILSLSIYELCTFHVPMLCYYYVNLWDDCLTEMNNLNLIWYYLYIHPTIWHLHCTVIHPCASSICQLIIINILRTPFSSIFNYNTYSYRISLYTERPVGYSVHMSGNLLCSFTIYDVHFKTKKMSLKAVFN